MSSNVYANPVINRTGTVPGVIQGLLADRPAEGYVDGDWYMATDTRILYRWDLATTTWLPILDYFAGSGGLTGTLTNRFVPRASGPTSLVDSTIEQITSTSINMGNLVKVKVGSSGTAHGSSIMEVASNVGGFLVPRMLAAARAAIPSPTTALLVYQTDGVAGFYYYNGTAWTLLGGPGLAGLVPNFIPMATSPTSIDDSPMQYIIASTAFATGNAIGMRVGSAFPPIAGSVFQVDGLATIDGTAAARHFSGFGAVAPTIAAGAGGDATATVSLVGNDAKGVITVTAAGTPGTNAIIATISFNVAYATAPVVILTNGNTATQNGAITRHAFVDPSSTTTTTFSITSGPAALVAGTTYIWSYFVIQ